MDQNRRIVHVLTIHQTPLTGYRFENSDNSPPYSPCTSNSIDQWQQSSSVTGKLVEASITVVIQANSDYRLHKYRLCD